MGDTHTAALSVSLAPAFDTQLCGVAGAGGLQQGAKQNVSGLCFVERRKQTVHPPPPPQHTHTEGEERTKAVCQIVVGLLLEAALAWIPGAHVPVTQAAGVPLHLQRTSAFCGVCKKGRGGGKEGHKEDTRNVG